MKIFFERKKIFWVQTVEIQSVLVNKIERIVSRETKDLVYKLSFYTNFGLK